MQVLDLARRHYRTTTDYLELLESGDREGIVSGGNWELYVRIADGETVPLQGGLEREARGLLVQWDALVERSERHAYLSADYVIKMRFPWKGGMDLHENLHKILTPEEMG